MLYYAITILYYKYTKLSSVSMLCYNILYYMLSITNLIKTNLVTKKVKKSR